MITFKNIALHQGQIAHLNDVKDTVPTLSLVDIQNMLVDPDGELFVYLKNTLNSLLSNIDFNFSKDYNKIFTVAITNLLKDVSAAETAPEARTILSDSLINMISKLEEYVAEYRLLGRVVAIEKMTGFKTLSELNVAPVLPVAPIFNQFIQFAFLKDVVLGGLIHLPVSFIETINSSVFPSISGANSVTNGCVEIEITKLINYALENASFEPA